MPDETWLDETLGPTPMICSLVGMSRSRPPWTTWLPWCAICAIWLARLCIRKARFKSGCASGLG